MLLVIPLPLFFAQTVYGVRGLEAWVVIGMIWTFTSAFSVVLYPLWESRAALVLIAKGMMKVSQDQVRFRSVPLNVMHRTSFPAEVGGILRQARKHPKHNYNDIYDKHQQLDAACIYNDLQTIPRSYCQFGGFLYGRSKLSNLLVIERLQLFNVRAKLVHPLPYLFRSRRRFVGFGRRPELPCGHEPVREKEETGRAAQDLDERNAGTVDPL